MAGMRAKYIGKDLVAMQHGKTYDIISVERGWYRILTELDEDYLFPPEAFEIVENADGMKQVDLAPAS